MLRFTPTRLVLLVLFGLIPAADVRAQAPLVDRIDQHIVAGHKDYAKVASKVAGDEEFLRRVHLDLTGVIPGAAETRAFLADTAADKRVKLVDRLLAGEEFALQMTNVFDLAWLDRRPEKHVKRAEWREFLRSSFAANKPYDQLVREVLSADGGDPKNRAAAAFFLNRDAEAHQVTKDISRLFLGMNLQCAQCHDHPLVEHYKQDFYYGIYAFLSRSYLYADKATKLTVLAEKGDGEVSFQSVFVAKVTKNTGPRLPLGMELKEPKFDKGQEYVTAVKAGERGIPKHSRRAQLAGVIVGPENTRFARSAVNRFWFLLMGRGIVNPVEFDHPENPPSHPELLDVLTKEFVASKYDMRAIFRAIVLSKTYQRSSEVPAEVKDVEPKIFATAALRPLTPEQFAWSLMQGTGLVDIERKGQGAKATPKSIHDKLAGNVGQFVNLFGNLPGEPAINQDFEATLDQTLFLSNGATLREWASPRPGNLSDRLNQLKDAGQVAEELYLSLLTRQPTADERKDVADFLGRPNAVRATVLQELVWALLTSAEIRFNH